MQPESYKKQDTYVSLQLTAEGKRFLEERYPIWCFFQRVRLSVKKCPGVVKIGIVLCIATLAFALGWSIAKRNITSSGFQVGQSANNGRCYGNYQCDRMPAPLTDFIFDKRFTSDGYFRSCPMPMFNAIPCGRMIIHCPDESKLFEFHRMVSHFADIGGFILVGDYMFVAGPTFI